MRVLIVKKGLARIGGSESHARTLARHLAARGHAVSLVGLRPPWRRAGLDDADEFQDGPVRVTLLTARYGALGSALDSLAPTDFLDERRLARLASGADVVHCFAREYARPAERVARGVAAAFVETPLAHPAQFLGGGGAADVARYRRADALCAMTNWERNWYAARGVDRSRVHVTGVGAIFDAPLPEREPDPATVLFVGRREAYKGFPALARAMHHVWSARPDARLVVIGQRAWHAPFTDLALVALRDPRCVDLGVVDEAAKAAAYARSAVVALPSRHETFGQTILEAWLARRPVLAGDIPPLREVVDGAGVLVPQEPRAIADALLALFADVPRARALAARGHARATTRFAWPAVAERVERAYEAARGADLDVSPSGDIIAERR